MIVFFLKCKILHIWENFKSRSETEEIEVVHTGLALKVKCLDSIPASPLNDQCNLG